MSFKLPTQTIQGFVITKGFSLAKSSTQVRNSCAAPSPPPQTGTAGTPQENPSTDKQKEFPLPSACHGKNKHNRTNREFGDAQKHRPRGKARGAQLTG